MELGLIVYGRGVSFSYRLFGVVSFHLRGGKALLAFVFAFEALAALYTPCMQCDFLPLV